MDVQARGGGRVGQKNHATMLTDDMAKSEIDTCITDYFQCAPEFLHLDLSSDAGQTGYFRVGADTICYGHVSGQQAAASPDKAFDDVLFRVETENGCVCLPFDPCEVVSNLQREIYVGDWRSNSSSAISKMYYLIRPFLPVGVRKHLQKFHLRKWDERPFPHWPVDFSVDNLMRQLLLLSLRQSGARRIPFIWFWPEGKSACALMTHDVEEEAGRDFCSTLMDIDEAYGIRASMQVVPEERYQVTPEFLDSLRSRGFEVVVHDLNHDGHLYTSHEQFLERARKINAYCHEFGADGFRAGALYRKQAWFDALHCSYDMSVPNVAHLDPQPGGCCTVMPYFIGDMLEIPVTTIQDYSLFNILNDYSIDIWKRQTSAILARNGLMSFIVHPDYIATPRPRAVYEALLDHLRSLCRKQNVWNPVPKEVDRWWRQRAQMKVVERNGAWQIEGPGSERARLAWASEIDGQLSFSLDGASASGAPSPAEIWTQHKGNTSRYHAVTGDDSARAVVGNKEVIDRKAAGFRR
jgi:hypothetical protein